MHNEAELLHYKSEEIHARAAALSTDEIEWLVGLLASADDKIRYPAFLLLRERSLAHSDVYPFWDVFLGKLDSENSYQRSIGIMLLAINARWDDGEQTAAVLDAYLALLKDEKPITVRQCVQSLAFILPSHPALAKRIADRLLSLDLLEIRDTMRKLVLVDVIDVMLLIRETAPGDSIDAYLFAALSGDLLDAKLKKQILARMGASSSDK